MRPSVGCLIVLLAACRVAPPSLTDADKASIRAVSDSFVVMFRADRDSAQAELYTQNAVLMPPNTGIVEGRPAIRAFLKNYPAMTDFTLTSIDVDGRGDLAYVRGTYAFSLPAAGGRPAVSDHGKFIEIRRREGGKWLMTADIFNSDVPATATPSR
jgi:ketosteroid isomerase-like protein